MKPIGHWKRIRGLAVVISCVCLLGRPGLKTALAQELRAGCARLDVTPTQPVTMAGYESRKELSRGVHDPVSARATAFEQGGHRLVLISLDTCGFYNGTAAPFRMAILDACGLNPSELFLCAIHTHSAPALTLNSERGHPNNLEYTKSLQGKLVAAARSALDRLAPVQIGFGSGSCPVGANRREVVPEDDGKSHIILGRNPVTPIDREVQALKLVRPGQNQIAGALFAYPTHSTALGPRNYLISGDVHGLAEQFLEHYFGADLVVPGFAGASGNIDPWFRVVPDFKTNNGWLPAPVLLGTFLGEEVAQVLESIHGFVTNAPIKSSLKVVDLPAKAPDDAASLANPTLPFTITVARMGDIAFVGLGGEVFNEIGLAIKAASPFRHTFILTHCNGAAGYVPTRSSYPEGGYEVQTSPFAPGADEVLSKEATRLLKQLQ
ncbi:MAG TPA: neutral/alkaline non-lysosomal ceramidase N-terminal domain-containing protein [Dongiaceae bacterium]|nr:neutral/alkaline non-lysosomal ceramidase N-terminal domain-containing protein [Dongiaceae bacterium]